MSFTGNATKMIAAIAVCAILILSVLVPFIADNGGTTERRTTLLNTGTSLIEGDVADDYTIQWDSALPGMVKVNGNVTTVYFVAGDDATVSPESKTVTVDLTYGELPVPTRTGYTFDGWYDSTQYTNEITEDTVVVGTSDKILYAKWVGNEYTVTFNAGSGTVSPATKTVRFGEAYGELPVPEYTGHNFGGWFDANDNVITSATIVNIAADHTLDAEYTIAQYLITFTTDGNGTVSTQSVTVDYGTSYTVSSNTVTIDGTTVTATPDTSYVFDHWTPGTSGTVEGAMTFTAYFNLPPVTLTFTAQSPGAVDVATINDVPRGTQYVVADNTVVVGSTTVTATLPNGYYMTGWNIAQGVGTVTDAMTFTAEYEVIEIASFSASRSMTWVVTTDGKLFGCGYNGAGASESGIVQRLDTETIDKVYCSGTTTWVVTTDGKLFGCGMGTYGQQGSGNTSAVNTFTQRLNGETIASVSCSDNSTWAVTTDGKLFGCGINTSGQQGDGTTTNVSTFTQRLNGETIASVSCSDSTTWAVTTDGKLFGCGAANIGQMGVSGITSVKSFTQCLDTETIASVSCSTNTTWAVTTDGKLFGCGSDGYENQGNGETTGDIKTFTQRLDTETIAMVSATNKTTWAVTTDGKLFGCGDGSGGKQGNNATTVVNTFTQRLNGETIASVNCSESTTWAVTTDGKLFGCGLNDTGQQGNGNTTNVKTFTQRLNGETIASVNCSDSTTWAVTTDGKLFGCGKNTYGNQGDGTTTDVTTFTQRGPPGLVNIATPVSPQQINLNPIHLNPSVPFTPIPLSPMSITASAIVGTDYTFQAGGNDWMLATVSTGQDQYAIALYYAGLTEPLVWDDDVTFSFSNGTMTVVNGGQTYTMDYTSIYYKGNGDYILTNESAYVKSDTQIIGYAIPTTDSGIEVTGTIGDLEALAIADGSITIGDAAVTTADTDYENVYTMSGLSATYDTDQTASCTSVIVPKKVIVTETVENETMDAMLSVIPLVMIVGLVMGVVGGFIYKRI